MKKIQCNRPFSHAEGEKKAGREVPGIEEHQICAASSRFTNFLAGL